MKKKTQTVQSPENRLAIVYVRMSDRKGRGTKAGGRDFLSPDIQHPQPAMPTTHPKTANE